MSHVTLPYLDHEPGGILDMTINGDPATYPDAVAAKSYGGAMPYYIGGQVTVSDFQDAQGLHMMARHQPDLWAWQPNGSSGRDSYDLELQALYCWPPQNIDIFGSTAPIAPPGQWDSPTGSTQSSNIHNNASQEAEAAKHADYAQAGHDLVDILTIVAKYCNRSDGSKTIDDLRTTAEATADLTRLHQLSKDYSAFAHRYASPKFVPGSHTFEKVNFKKQVAGVYYSLSTLFGHDKGMNASAISVDRETLLEMSKHLDFDTICQQGYYQHPIVWLEEAIQNEFNYRKFVEGNRIDLTELSTSGSGSSMLAKSGDKGR